VVTIANFICSTIALAASAVNSPASSSHSADTGVLAWSITAPDGESSVIIGSLHSADRGLKRPAFTLFDHARFFVVEHLNEPFIGDVAEPLAGSRAAWAADLSQDEVTIFVKRAACAGFSKDGALTMLSRPSAQVANQYAYTICYNHPVKTRDELMADYAEAKGLIPLPLEDDAWVEIQRRKIPDSIAATSFK